MLLELLVDSVLLPSFQIPEHDDLPTIDSATLASLSEDFEDVVPLIPTTPLATFATPAKDTTPTAPIVPPLPSCHQEQVSNIEVGDEVVRSCVTPRKFLVVKDVLKTENERHKCALKLLTHFFTSAELISSNTDGTHNKLPLDAARLNALKILVFSRFPVECPVEKQKCWKLIKGKINGKCRLNKHIHKQATEVRETETVNHV